MCFCRRDRTSGLKPMAFRSLALSPLSAASEQHSTPSKCFLAFDLPFALDHKHAGTHGTHNVHTIVRTHSTQHMAP